MHTSRRGPGSPRARSSRPTTSTRPTSSSSCTATDAAGLTSTVTRRLDPKTVDAHLRVRARPACSCPSARSAAPRRSRARSSRARPRRLSAPAPQTLGGRDVRVQRLVGRRRGRATRSPRRPRRRPTARRSPSRRGAGGPGRRLGLRRGRAAPRRRTPRAAATTGTISGADARAGGSLRRARSASTASNDWVTVADAASLDLTTGMTLEAWVNPAALGTAWRTALLKEHGGTLAYALYAHDGGNRPGRVRQRDGSDLAATASPALTLERVDARRHDVRRRDAARLRRRRPGRDARGDRGAAERHRAAADRRQRRLAGEFFSGRIDEVRVYNRALSAAEVAADVTTPVGSRGPPPPRLAVTPASLAFTATSGGAAAGAADARRRQHGRRRAAVHGDRRRGLAHGDARRAARRRRRLTATASIDRPRAGDLHRDRDGGRARGHGRAGDDPGDADGRRARAAGARGDAGVAGVRGDGRRRRAGGQAAERGATRAAGRSASPRPTTRRG